MKKIVFLNLPGNLNIGNEFINIGARYLAKQAILKSGITDYKWYESELWETSSLSKSDYRANWNTSEMISFINESDLIIVPAGSIVNSHAKFFLEKVALLKPPKILLGAGRYLYNENEKHIAHSIVSKFDFVLARDRDLYEIVKDSTLSSSGIDMAFFINDAYLPPIVLGKYAVINIDFDFLHRFQIFKKHKEFKKKFNKVYITENTSKLHKKENFIFLSRWSEFCNLYSNAAFVSTMRIHTSVLCVLYSVPFEYLGGEKRKTKKRAILFEQIGMKINEKRSYSKKELDRYQTIINKKKKETQFILTEKIKSIIS